MSWYAKFIPKICPYVSDTPCIILIRPSYISFNASPGTILECDRPQSNYKYIGFEVLTPVVMKSSVFWDIKPSVNGLHSVISQMI
jgi:hypothetical protein